MIISEEVLAILSICGIRDKHVTLPQQLDRKMYQAVNKVLSHAGGKWSRSSQTHEFQEPAGEIIEQILVSGEVTDIKKEFGFFETPSRLVAQMIDEAELSIDLEVLEPSAGRGAIATEVRNEGCYVMAIELLASNITALLDLDFKPIQADFLTMKQEPRFDRVLMNPPFAKQADLDHVTHALGFLKPNGILVAIMAAGVLFRENSKTKIFHEMLKSHQANFIKLPVNSFSSSGTNVASCMLVVRV